MGCIAWLHYHPVSQPSLITASVRLIKLHWECQSDPFMPVFTSTRSGGILSLVLDCLLICAICCGCPWICHISNPANYTFTLNLKAGTEFSNIHLVQYLSLINFVNFQMINFTSLIKTTPSLWLRPTPASPATWLQWAGKTTIKICLLPTDKWLFVLFDKKLSSIIRRRIVAKIDGVLAQLCPTCCIEKSMSGSGLEDFCMLCNWCPHMFYTGLNPCDLPHMLKGPVALLIHVDLGFISITMSQYNSRQTAGYW